MPNPPLRRAKLKTGKRIIAKKGKHARNGTRPIFLCWDKDDHGRAFDPKTKFVFTIFKHERWKPYVKPT